MSQLRPVTETFCPCAGPCHREGRMLLYDTSESDPPTCQAGPPCPAVQTICNPRLLLTDEEAAQARVALEPDPGDANRVQVTSDTFSPCATECKGDAGGTWKCDLDLLKEGPCDPNVWVPPDEALRKHVADLQTARRAPEQLANWRNTQTNALLDVFSTLGPPENPSGKTAYVEDTFNKGLTTLSEDGTRRFCTPKELKNLFQVYLRSARKHDEIAASRNFFLKKKDEGPMCISECSRRRWSRPNAETRREVPIATCPTALWVGHDEAWGEAWQNLKVLEGEEFPTCTVLDPIVNQLDLYGIAFQAAQVYNETLAKSARLTAQDEYKTPTAPVVSKDYFEKSKKNDRGVLKFWKRYFEGRILRTFVSPVGTRARLLPPPSKRDWNAIADSLKDAVKKINESGSDVAVRLQILKKRVVPVLTTLLGYSARDLATFARYNVKRWGLLPSTQIFYQGAFGTPTVKGYSLQHHGVYIGFGIVAEVGHQWCKSQRTSGLSDCVGIVTLDKFVVNGGGSIYEVEYPELNLQVDRWLSPPRGRSNEAKEARKAETNAMGVVKEQLYRTLDMIEDHHWDYNPFTKSCQHWSSAAVTGDPTFYQCWWGGATRRSSKLKLVKTKACQDRACSVLPVPGKNKIFGFGCKAPDGTYRQCLN